MNYRQIRGPNTKSRWPATHKVFDVHESVRRNTTTKVTNKMQLYRLIYFSLSSLHISGDVFGHHQEHLTVFTVSIHPRHQPAATWVNTTRYCKYSQVLRMMGAVFAHHQEHLTVFTVSTHPRHQPAATWVNTSRYCKYSQVLLIMGENIARNM